MIFIKSIQPKNILSFGPDTEPIELRDLNILIGPNGSGKSNLLLLISLLKEAKKDYVAPIRNTGGWIEWSYLKQKSPGSLKVTINTKASLIRHETEFKNNATGKVIFNEVLSEALKHDLDVTTDHNFVNIPIKLDELDELLGDEDSSILYNINTRDSKRLRLKPIADKYSNIGDFKIWSIALKTLKEAQSVDKLSYRLQPDASNFHAIIDEILSNKIKKDKFLYNIQKVIPGATDFALKNMGGGNTQFYIIENETTFFAPRLSDGTLRYIYLLCILLHADLFSLICFDEPELGLHPDMISTIADLLKEASTSCQLIVTTHSPQLVSEFTNNPESVVVCEKHDGATQMKRLNPKEVTNYLQNYYTLGNLWMSGQIGGVT